MDKLRRQLVAGTPVLGSLASLGWVTPCAAQPLQLIVAAREQTSKPVRYDGTYTKIPYPMGDVPTDRGVCTDVVIRAYRRIGIDLQQLVHEDMRANFALYPRNWGLKQADSNIDHRRVPNLQKFFERKGASIQNKPGATLLQAGDMVTFMLPANLPHIGLVSDRYASARLLSASRRPLMIHNIGAGAVEEDMLDLYPITGHYRYRVR